MNALSPIIDPEIEAVVDLAQLRSLCSHGESAGTIERKVARLNTVQACRRIPHGCVRAYGGERIVICSVRKCIDKKVDCCSAPCPQTKQNGTKRLAHKGTTTTCVLLCACSCRRLMLVQDLVRRLLEPLASLPEPTEPFSPSDQSILDVYNDISTIPPGLLVTLEEEPESCPQCPLEEGAPEDVRIKCAGNLDIRLRLIRARDAGDSGAGEPSMNDTPEIRLDVTPEIRLDATPEVRLEEPSPTTRTSQDNTPEISLQVPDSPTSTHSGLSTTLLPSRPYSSVSAHNKHSSALLRLLYIHSCLNPANRYPQIGSLLIPIYAALVEEVDTENLPHVEADTFWVFESMVGEFSELEDEQSGTTWVRKLSERLRWADPELADDLVCTNSLLPMPWY